nr:MAG TPA: hypothetical protein [Caudoviricetes sp.]
MGFVSRVRVLLGALLESPSCQCKCWWEGVFLFWPYGGFRWFPADSCRVCRGIAWPFRPLGSCPSFLFTPAHPTPKLCCNLVDNATRLLYT